MHRNILKTAVAALVVSSTLAAAQSYPSKPVHFTVPFAPGGSTDVQGRL